LADSNIAQLIHINHNPIQKMKKTLLTLLIATGLATSANSAVTINLEGAELFDSLTNPMADGSLVYAISLGSSGTFSSLQPGSWVSGDNIQIGNFWTTNSDVTGDPGGFSAAVIFDLTGGVSTGQQFGMVWFPTLTNQTVAPTGGLSYGFYSQPDWLIPGDGAVIGTGFETVSVGGPIPNSAGVASLNVVPEPSTYALMALGGLVMFYMIRRRKAQA
jgi:hypothetical protein